MLHLATIEHCSNYYILLPHAEYGDLEQFLHCGMGPKGKEIYNFDTIFSGVRKNSNIAPLLLSQCLSLAHALEWLHNGVKIEGSPSTVFCAHMDLKPANILIFQDASKSAVGKWVISDFGISVLKEEREQHDPNFGSVLDYFSQVTLNTRPKRGEGTYQAPDVKQTATAFNQAHRLRPDQKGIGRKSDIWSYGCIFSEVLAFALGRDTLVNEFQSIRKGASTFYVEKTDQRYLGVPNHRAKQYHVHPSILEWLARRCGDQTWVECYVETIKSILIVDAKIRPDATALTKLVSHVKVHAESSPLNFTCSLLLARDQAIPSTMPDPWVIGEQPAYAHGIVINYDVRRIKQRSESFTLPMPEDSKFKASHLALTSSCSSNEIRAAYLGQSWVYVYSLDVEGMSARIEGRVELPQPAGWKDVAVAGHFLAVWGYHTEKMVNFSLFSLITN
jgi:serine/threonine protein kinase